METEQQQSITNHCVHNLYKTVNVIEIEFCV